MKKRIALFLIHFPIWVVAFGVSHFFGTEKYPGGTVIDNFLATIIYLIWSLGSFYIFYSYLIPQYLEKGKTIYWRVYSGLVVLVIFPFWVIFSVYALNLTPSSFSDLFSKQGLGVWVFCVIITFFCATLGSLFRFSIDWFYNLHTKNEIENIQLKNELNTIKSRLNPHFLFNTLNNIDTLIQTNPSKASVVLSMLSDLLRYVVYETEKEKIEIKKEMNFIKKYIDLEKIRLSNPDAVSFVCSIEHNLLIPPMIFLPFIENGFKHCNLNAPDCKLFISFTEKNNELIFRCINPMNMPENNSKEKGIGLKLVKERLKLLYPDNHHLQIIRHNNAFDVNLKINLSDD